MAAKELRVEILSPDLPNELDMLSIFDKSIQSEDVFTAGIISNGLVENQTAEHVSFKGCLGLGLPMLQAKFFE
ncbi:hypothetical protein [Desulfosporosinus sp. OT]|uniref:hypothetical protein n=1 Tax=Desulfosporosinus sp. OT TaxID=913865 RepID=UPI000223ABEA|nr:hypothetical protein [Desulfosporosinus sp. OT]EGW40335.1 hypothetical protein DOT_1675 [Desulfosporosinus sp. OT]